MVCFSRKCVLPCVTWAAKEWQKKIWTEADMWDTFMVLKCFSKLPFRFLKIKKPLLYHFKDAGHLIAASADISRLVLLPYLGSPMSQRCLQEQRREHWSPRSAFHPPPSSFSLANLKVFDPRPLGQFPSLCPSRNTSPIKKSLYSISPIANS